MTDTSTAPKATADSADGLEGTPWQKKYDGLQRLLGQRTNDLAEARRIADEAIARAEQAERQAREYMDLASILGSAPEPIVESAPSTDDDDEADVYVDANRPIRRPQTIPEPKSSEDWLERLRSMSPPGPPDISGI